MMADESSRKTWTARHSQKSKMADASISHFAVSDLNFKIIAPKVHKSLTMGSTLNRRGMGMGRRGDGRGGEIYLIALNLEQHK